jgi:hypothetical protein
MYFNEASFQLAKDKHANNANSANNQMYRHIWLCTHGVDWYVPFAGIFKEAMGFLQAASKKASEVVTRHVSKCAEHADDSMQATAEIAAKVRDVDCGTRSLLKRLDPTAIESQPNQHLVLYPEPNSTTHFNNVATELRGTTRIDSGIISADPAVKNVQARLAKEALTPFIDKLLSNPLTRGPFLSGKTYSLACNHCCLLD